MKATVEIEEVLIRSMRAGFTWMDNAIMDDWVNLLGTDVLSVYVLYCRRAMNETQSTKLAQEVVAEHLRVSKTTVSDALRILEWCDLIKVVRKHRSISKVYLKDTRPLTDEVRAELRAKIAAGTDYMHLRTMLISRLDAFLSLKQRLDLFVAKSEKQRIKIVRADELQPELPPPPPPQEPASNAHDEEWQQILERLKSQVVGTAFTWVECSSLVEVNGDNWTVECDSNLAKDWIENRLNGTLTRTIAQVTGREVALKFVVKETS